MTATEFKKQLPRVLPNEFVNFLKKKKIFRAYTDNCYDYIKKLPKEHITEHFENINSLDNELGLSSILCYSFNWSKTPQKYTFWAEVDDQFDAYLSNKGLM